MCVRFMKRLACSLCVSVASVYITVHINRLSPTHIHTHSAFFALLKSCVDRATFFHRNDRTWFACLFFNNFRWLLDTFIEHYQHSFQFDGVSFIGADNVFGQAIYNLRYFTFNSHFQIKQLNSFKGSIVFEMWNHTNCAQTIQLKSTSSYIFGKKLLECCADTAALHKITIFQSCNHFFWI